MKNMETEKRYFIISIEEGHILKLKIDGWDGKEKGEL